MVDYFDLGGGLKEATSKAFRIPAPSAETALSTPVENNHMQICNHFRVDTADT